MARLTFHGAAETVTGSKYLLEAGRSKVLIDCGLFQGLKELRERNWQRLPFNPAHVNAVVLTHAHIDHCGYLPRFVKDGFRRPVYSTPATESLCELLLLDAAHNQEEEADYANRKGFSKHKPALPLFDAGDVKRTMSRFRTVRRDEWFSPAEPIWVRYHDTGHLLGSCMIEVEIREGDTPLRLVFSGDVGRYDAPLYFDPKPPPQCDYLICESTYGDREHPPLDVFDQLAIVVNDAIARGGVMLVASFAVGRAQQLIYLLQRAHAAEAHSADPDLSRQSDGGQRDEYLSLLRLRARPGRGPRGGLGFRVQRRSRKAGSHRGRVAANQQDQGSGRDHFVVGHDDRRTDSASLAAAPARSRQYGGHRRLHGGGNARPRFGRGRQVVPPVRPRRAGAGRRG